RTTPTGRAEHRPLPGGGVPARGSHRTRDPTTAAPAGRVRRRRTDGGAGGSARTPNAPRLIGRRDPGPAPAQPAGPSRPGGSVASSPFGRPVGADGRIGALR